MMNPQLKADITRLLKERHGMKDRGKWLRGGICPSCKEEGFYANAENPWRAYCGRLNNCAHEATAKDLFPDLFEDWSTRFKQSDDNPHAAADAYLENGRGFNLTRVRGSYTQESYHAADSGQVTATVRFAIPGGSWWERFIDRAYRFGKMKARFAPGKSYMGEVWVPPTVTGEVLGTAEEIWIVEGIFDAIALGHHGVVAVSAMSCNNYPKAFLQRLLTARSGRLPTLVWALDGDTAGRNHTVSWVKKGRADGFRCEAATIRQQGGEKSDWNDLHLEGLLSPENIKDYRYEGALLIARTPKDRAILMYKHTKNSEFSLEFGNRIYWYEFSANLYQRALNDKKPKGEDDDERQDEEARKEEALQLASKINVIANCYPEPLYFQKNLLTNEHWYYVRVTTSRGLTVKDTFRGDQLASAGEFKKRLMSVAAGASFSGTTQQLDRHWGDDLQVIKHVEAIDFVGYSREHGAYLLGQLAVKAGSIIHINDEDFFELGKHVNVKSPTKSVALIINHKPDSFATDWVEKVWRCWGAGGMVALTFWFASLFAEQIRQAQESFPFLELIGEPGSGKSTLVRFLWKLMGRAGYEGIDPSKSTLAARARAFVQVANLPVVLVEGDRKDDTAKAKKFDFNELKTAYNGGSIRALGVKSSGNETIEPPFRGSIVIEQNATVQADRAVLERIVHLNFDKAGHKPETKAIAEELARMEMANLSHFILRATKAEASVLATMTERVPTYETELLNGVVYDLRLAKNHAQLIAAFDALCDVITLSDEAKRGTQAFLRQMAARRQSALAADHPDVQLFWELYDYVNPMGGSEPILNHSKNPDFIAVSLPQFDAEMAARYMTRPSISDLKEHLKTSTSRKFIEVKNVKSARNGRATWCYVFKAPPKVAEPKE
ncbi:toprim domain-containing protein [Dyella sp. ASV21]|uniref:toprim domain-containing protein n=1 Tax=Dyella sp. ASV21 TaxID=2795114 RepID=UPI0018ED4DEC|nr:toprim domain-containing protein [Dyella sp. ASV21]